MRFWLDMGVDGFRLDAIPYLVEREGTNCENLPETHAVIKQHPRRRSTRDCADQMLLAEANQWPNDVRPYFGDGDECQMAFHFPLMPRIFMALRQEDRMPIIDIMAADAGHPPQLPVGPLPAQPRRADARDGDRRGARLHVPGVQRRPPHAHQRGHPPPPGAADGNNRRRIELLNSLLFSFPGTPIIYYGDEIGMGDNIYLGDRNGVRTPMQWSADRNAGFSGPTRPRSTAP